MGEARRPPTVHPPMLEYRKLYFLVFCIPCCTPTLEEVGRAWTGLVRAGQGIGCNSGGQGRREVQGRKEGKVGRKSDGVMV